MSRRADVVTGVVAVGLHIVLAATMVEAPVAAPARPRPIEVELRPPAAEQPVPPPRQAQPPPPAPKPRAVRRKLAPAVEPRPAAEAPAEPTPEPRPEPRTRAPLPPVFGIAMDSPTTASSAFALPLGGTTAANPASPSRRSTPNGSLDGAPVSELEIKSMPEIDTDACGRSVTYPDEAKRNGIQGKVRLRVTLTAQGRVSSARVLSGLGYGLDQAAVEALTRRCRFSPAIAHDGRPVPFVVESYTFNFELPR